MKTILGVLVIVFIPVLAFGITGNVFVQNAQGLAQTVFCTPEGSGDTMPNPIGVQVFDGFTPVTGIPAENIRLFIGTHGFGMPHVSKLCDGTFIEASSGTNTSGTAYFPTGPFEVFDNSGDGPYWFHVEVYYGGVWV